MATPRKFETKDKVLHRHSRLGGVVENIRRDTLGGSGCYYEIQAGRARFPPPTPSRDELLVKFEDGSVSWCDSDNIMLRGDN